MNPGEKRRKLWDSKWNKNAIVILLIVVIILAAYSLVSNSPDESMNIISIADILENSAEYKDKNIAVEGYYYHENYPEGMGVITSNIIVEGQSSTSYQRLQVNHSSVNTSGLLVDEVKYRFTGVLKSDLSGPVPDISVILVAEEIKPV